MLLYLYCVNNRGTSSIRAKKFATICTRDAASAFRKFSSLVALKRNLLLS